MQDYNGKRYRQQSRDNEMKIAEGLIENDIVIGNTFNKYDSINPIVRLIMKGFSQSLSALVAKVAPHTIHEVGCGEGFWTLDWSDQGIQARGSDFSEKVIGIARDNAKNRQLSPEIFSVCSVYDIEPERHSAELIVCCEVLEHLEYPKAALAAIQRVATHHIIFSVPREPIWRGLNMVGWKYLSDFGNTPGHLQHWSKRKFIELIGRYFDVIVVRTPIPWTMLLCRVKH